MIEERDVSQLPHWRMKLDPPGKCYKAHISDLSVHGKARLMKLPTLF